MTVAEPRTGTDTEVGATVIPVTGVVTVTVLEAETPPTVAVIVAEPFPTAVTTPDPLTVATVVPCTTGLERVTAQVRTGTMELDGTKLIAVTEVVPMVITKLFGARAMRLIGMRTAAHVTTQVAWNPPSPVVAVIVVNPGVKGVTMPFLTVATD